MKKFGPTPSQNVSLHGYSYDCWLMTSGFTSDKVKPDKIFEAKRVGICGIMDNRYFNSNSTNTSIGNAKPIIICLRRWQSLVNDLSDINSYMTYIVAQ